jgi:hypothetical protein
MISNKTPNSMMKENFTTPTVQTEVLKKSFTLKTLPLKLGKPLKFIY